MGLTGLCGAITKQSGKPKEYGSLYVDIMINGTLARAMVKTGAKVNIMTETTAKKLGLCYSPSNAQLRIADVPPNLVCGVMHGVSITLG